MPQSNTLGISQRIENEDERQRLRDLLMELEPTLKTLENGSGSEQRLDENPVLGKQANASGAGGYIARTAAEGATRDEIKNDMLFLQRLWQSISARIDAAEVPSNIYEDLPIVFRTLRDLSSAHTQKIRIDSKETHAKVMDFAAQFTPELVSRIEHYPGERPILDLYSTEDEIQRALQRKVDLKSGGHLVIDQTEAMTTFDVNTGGFVGHRNLEETIFKTNLEATQAIARQLRLRNLGGIIIIDFIDMAGEDHQRQVLRALEKGLDRDHSRITISEVTSLGLVQITRKRTRESLEHILCEQCPTCAGRGSIKSAESICYEIFREILREARQFDAEKLLVVASQTVVDMLLDEESTSIVELEEFIGIPIRFQIESAYTQEQYDVVLL
jgi:ribonuclease G